MNLARQLLAASGPVWFAFRGRVFELEEVRSLEIQAMGFAALEGSPLVQQAARKAKAARLAAELDALPADAGAEEVREHNARLAEEQALQDVAIVASQPGALDAVLARRNAYVCAGVKQWGLLPDPSVLGEELAKQIATDGAWLPKGFDKTLLAELPSGKRMEAVTFYPDRLPAALERAKADQSEVWVGRLDSPTVNAIANAVQQLGSEAVDLAPFRREA